MSTFRAIDPESIPYTKPIPREGSLSLFRSLDIEERWLVPPGEAFPVVMIRYGPNVTVPPHSHSEAEFIYVTRGNGTWNGAPIHAGMGGFVDKDVVYGPETSGPEGIEFIIMRPALARYQPAPDA